MLSGNELWSLVSLAVAFFALGLGLYVLHANPYAGAARVFFFAMVLMFLGGSADFVLMNAPDRDFAMGTASFLFFILVLQMGSLLYLATYLPYESSSGWFRRMWWLFFLFVGVTGLIPGILLQPGDLDQTSYGWGVQRSIALGSCWMIILLYALAAVAMLTYVYMRTEDRKSRTQIAIVALAVSAPVLYSLFYAIVDQIAINFPPIMSPGYLIAALMMAYAVLRHRMFTIEVKERAGGARPADGIATSKIERGTSLLFLERDGARAYSAFENEMAAGSVGVVVSNVQPEMLKEKLELRDAPAIWLSKQQGERRIDPANLGILQMSISDFLRHHKGGVVLIDGVGYLLANNSLESVLKVLYSLNDEVVVTQGLLMLSLDPQRMDKKGLAIFMRDFQVVEGKGAGTEI